MTVAAVFLNDGATQPIIAQSGDKDEEDDGYVFLLNSQSGIAGLFHKEILQSW